MTPKKKSEQIAPEQIVDNQVVFEALKSKNAELAVLNAIQDGLASGQDIDSIFELAGERIAEIFPGEGIALYTFDPETQWGEAKYILEDGVRHFPPPFESGPIGKRAAETKEPLVLSTTAEFEAIGATTIQGTAPSLSGIYTPLIVNDKWVGALNVESSSREHAFDDTDIRLVTTIARSLSVALENARLLKETEERNAELAIINTVQRALAAQLDIQGIYEAVGEKLRQIFDSQIIAIYSADLKTRINTTEYAYEKGQKFEPVSIPFSSLHDHLIELNDTYVFNGDFPEFAAQFADYSVSIGEMPKSIVGVPVGRKKGATKLLTLTQHDIDGEKTFNDSDIRLLETLANSMSVALENARLFNESQRLLNETEQHAAELQIINKVQEALASKLDLQAIYDLVGDEMRQIFNAETIYIGILDPVDNLAHHVYFVDLGERIFDEPPTVPTGFGGHVIKTRKPLLLNNVDEDVMNEYGSYWMGHEGQGDITQSWMGVPIIVGDKVLGAISIQNRLANAFTESDLRLLTTLTNSMSVALENARLFDESQRLLKETEQRAAELQIINSVQEGLASKLEMQAIYDLVGEKIREIFKADTTFIAFHDVDKDLVVAPYYTDKGERIETTTRPYGEGLVEIIIESGKSLLLNTSDEMNASGAYNIASPGSDKDLNQSFLGVPIFRGGRTIGATSVQSYQQYAFDPNDLSLLQTLTNSMSVALENARLFDETQRLLKETEQRAAEFATINTVSKALVAESDLDALIQIIGEQIRQVFSADIVYVALHDALTHEIQFPYTYGEDFKVLKLGEGLTSKIIETGEPLLINREMEKRRAEMGVIQVGVGARSYLGVPIKTRGQTFGVISVQSTTEEGHFGEGDQRLLNTIAANVGTAIRNAQLFEEVKRQSEYYAAVIDYSPAAIVLLDMKANVTGWNPAAEKLFGYKEDEALGRNIDDLVAKSDSLYSEAVRYSQKALQEKQVHLLARRTRKDETLVEVEVSSVPITIDGKQEVILAIYHDVSELQRARQEAEEANRAKSTFLANMSHELRTPLNAILGFTRIVRRKGEDVLPEKQLDNLDKVLVSADHLLNLINTVLDISKIEAGRVDVQPTSFILPPLIDLVVGTSDPLLRKGVTLKTDVPAGLPDVYSDQDKLMQILLNLLSNAAKFTHEGEITISSRHDGERIYVDVNDTGIGVSEDALARIFEDFQQADSSTTREYGGTGLGLPISRSLARLLGGDLVACSIEGEGSTFTLTLPIRYSEASTEAAAAVADAG